MSKRKPLSIQLDALNANKGTERGQALLAQSLQDVGAGRSILVDKYGRVIAGNKTYEAWTQLSDAVDVVHTQGDKLVVVQRDDLDLDDPQGLARRLAYYDNRVAELDLEWDASQILQDIEVGLQIDSLWNEEELAVLARSIEDNSPPIPEPQTEKADELRDKWGVESGQIWVLGRHRILCGDCTDQDVVERITDIPLTLMVTDPPYGVQYEPEWRQKAAEAGHLSSAARAIGQVQNDTRIDWSEAFALFSGKVAYIWSPGGDHILITGKAIQSCSFEIRCMIIWKKAHFAISRGAYHYQHEPCWYAVKKNSKADWIGDRSQSTIWDIPHTKNETGHGTQKPFECMARPIRNHAGDVYDPFLGSGTTLVACEQLGRQCRGIEIDPGYVAVTLQRWHEMTGKTPQLLG